MRGQAPPPPPRRAGCRRAARRPRPRRAPAACAAAPRRRRAPASPRWRRIPPNIKSLKSRAELTPRASRRHPGRASPPPSPTLANDRTPPQQTRARNALINEAMVNGLPQASAAYLDVYAQTLNGLLSR